MNTVPSGVGKFWNAALSLPFTQKMEAQRCALATMERLPSDQHIEILAASWDAIAAIADRSHFHLKDTIEQHCETGLNPSPLLEAGHAWVG